MNELNQLCGCGERKGRWHTGESKVIRHRVDAARELQSARYAGINHVHCNAHLSSRDVKKFCHLSDQVASRLENAITLLGLSARAYERVIKVARTIADLAGVDDIRMDDISEAINYRTLGRQA